MTGDSILALFDDSKAAANAAIATQQILQRQASETTHSRQMRYRIGLHTGR